jgi:hypothetical protein
MLQVSRRIPWSKGAREVTKEGLKRWRYTAAASPELGDHVALFRWMMRFESLKGGRAGRTLVMSPFLSLKDLCCYRERAVSQGGTTVLPWSEDMRPDCSERKGPRWRLLLLPIGVQGS